MHQVVRGHLEEYLSNANNPRVPPELPQHLASCRECREEVEGMRRQCLLLRSLQVSESLDPAAGFYARVIDRIDSQRTSSIWSIFLDPIFGRKLVFACLSLVMLLGAYMVSQEPPSVLTAGSPEVIMAIEPHPFEVSGSDVQQDRENVLVALASYQE
jgi:hypothetical protein